MYLGKKKLCPQRQQDPKKLFFDIRSEFRSQGHQPFERTSKVEYAAKIMSLYLHGKYNISSVARRLREVGCFKLQLTIFQLHNYVTAHRCAGGLI